MLNVQEYLKSGKTLGDLIETYCLNANFNNDLGVVCLNYNQFLSPMDNPISQECRGLILELDSWDVVSRSFFKFWNYGEELASPLDWDTIKVLDKIDGSLVNLWYYKKEWRISTRGTTDASGPVGDSDTTFRNLVLTTIKDMWHNKMSWFFEPHVLKQTECFNMFCSYLLPDMFYSFELTAPENRIVCFYPERTLTAIAAWDRDTLKEVDVVFEILPPCCPIVKSYPLKTIDNIITASKEINPLEREGFVLVDGNNNRVKIKSPDYVLAHRICDSMNSEVNRLEIVLRNKADDVLSIEHIPDGIKDNIKELQSQLYNICNAIEFIYSSIKNETVQKDFAIKAMATPYAWILFEMRKGKILSDLIGEEGSGGHLKYVDRILQHIKDRRVANNATTQKEIV